MSLFEKIRIVIKEENAEDSKKSKAQNYTDKINRKNKNRKEFQFDPKTKERQTFKGKITSGPQKGQGYTIFRRDGGDVKKGVDKGVLPKAAKGAPIDVKSPAHKDLFKRYNKGEPKATQFMIDLGKDDRKARGLGKRAERVKDASGGKKTGSLSKGNLSFPGDRTGAYSRTKSEIEFNKALKKARGNTEGDLPKETPQSVRDYAKKVRGERIKKYKLPDTSFDAKDKFVQKDFNKSLKDANKAGVNARKARAQAFKDVQTDPEFKGQLAGSKPTFDKKFPKFVKPEDPFKGATGKVTTPSKSKGIKLTTPKDIKLPASFGDFEKKLKTYKADVAKTSSKTPKKITKLTGTYGPAGAPQKGTIVKTPVKTPPTPSGTYSMVGTGKKEVVSRKKFVQSVLKSPEYVKAKESKPNPSKFIDQDTGKTFNMADPADKEKYLKQYGKDKFIKQTGGGAGGSGGGSGRGGGGFLPGGSGRSGGRNFKGMAKKFGGKLKNFAKANPLATALAVGAAGYYGYKGIKRAIDGPQLDPRKDFTKTGKIQFGTGSTKDDRDNKKVGDPVRFTYGRKETKNRAKPFLTPDTKKSDGSVTKGSISKFRDKVYTVKDKSGKTIDVNKRIQNSAFTKQLRDASTSKKQSAQDFIKKYKKAAEYRGITT